MLRRSSLDLPEIRGKKYRRHNISMIACLTKWLQAFITLRYRNMLCIISTFMLRKSFDLPEIREGIHAPKTFKLFDLNLMKVIRDYRYYVYFPFDV